MERKLNAELWDKMHYLFRDFNDRMVHVELHYDFKIDIDALKTVLICFFEKERLFGKDEEKSGEDIGEHPAGF